MMITDQSENMCYVGRRDCGCIVLAVVDNPEHKKTTAKEIAKGIRDGLKIERTTCQYVRDNMRKCPHKQKVKESPLSLLERGGAE